MSNRTTFEKFLLSCIVTGSVIVLFGTGVVVGSSIATNKLQQAATQNCGARFNELTGEFAWIECPPPAPVTEVVAPDPDPEPAIEPETHNDIQPTQ